MPKAVDIFALLRRGGTMTAEEVNLLSEEFTEAQISEFASSIAARSFDQPVKVVPFSHQPRTSASGYFTKQKYIFGKTPSEMEAVLGIFGILVHGAQILEFQERLGRADFENRAYSYLPDGKPYVPDPNERTYLPGHGAPQWVLTRPVLARCIASVMPGAIYHKSSPGC